VKFFSSGFRVPGSRLAARGGHRITISGRAAAGRRQHGAVLFIALIVLVAKTLAGIAIIRSVDTTTLIAGNLAFKQGTLHSSDNGIEGAFKWLTDNRATLANTTLASGYYSAHPAGELNWNDSATWASAVTVGTDAAGNTISYLVHRMCTLSDSAYNAPNQQCALDAPVGAPPPPAAGDSFVVGAPAFMQDPRVYYRITVRAQGPRNTTSFVQSMVAIAL